VQAAFISKEPELAPKILIVEDHEDSREVLIFQLSCMGYDVVVAENGKEGIEKAQSYLPDLIIMDLGLPDINGIQATEKIKRNPKTAHIPVIAHTAWDEETFKSAGIKAGIALFLTKPTPPNRFQTMIERYLQPHKSN